MKITTTKTNKHTVNVIQTDKFKTNRILVSFVGTLGAKNVAARALLPYLLKAISTSYPSRDKMSKALEDMYAAHLHVSVGKVGLSHTISFDLSVVQDEYLLEKETLFEKGFAFLHEILYHPRFSEQIFQEEKRLMHEYFLGIYANKLKYAMKQLHDTMYENEDYKTSALGSLEQLEKITLKDVKKAYQEMINENLVYISIVGNKPEEELIQYVETYLPLHEKTLQPTFLDHFQKEIVDVTKKEEIQNVQQAKLMVGYRFPVYYGDKMYPAAALFNSYFGGTSESVLFRQIREKRSLVYYISSSYDSYKGALYIRAGINAEDVDTVLTEIDKAVKEIIQGIIDCDMVDIIRKTIINNVLEGLDSPAMLAHKSIRLAMMDQPFDVKKSIRDINKVTAEDIQQLATKLTKDTIFVLRGEEHA